MKRDVLTVFLASPSDLNNERKITREAVERVNALLSRRVGWHIELLGWEDTLPGYSRPQEDINKDVDSCDLFVGMVWRRWGTPTGECCSGFHEEFRRTRDRRLKEGNPEIWLFFKAIDEDSLQDPGSQLKRVLDFKREQIEKKELRFKEFPNENKWGEIIYDSLVAYVLDLARKEQEAQPEKAEAISVQVSQEVPPSDVEESPAPMEYPADLALVLQKAGDYITGESVAELDYSDKIRLFLLASSWFSSAHLHEQLGVHETNLVYSKGKSWTLTNEERRLIFRTIVGDKYSTRPGWYWFRDWEEKRLDEVVYTIATSDYDAEVRRMAFSLLNKTGYVPSEEIIKKGLGDDDSKVVLETIKLIERSGLSQHVGLLDSAIESSESEIRNSAIAARLDLIFSENPNDAFREFIERGIDPPPCLIAGLVNQDLGIEPDELVKALDSRQTQARRFAVNYLKKTGKLTREKARFLLEDPDMEVRRQALWILIDSDEKITLDQIGKIFPLEKKGRTHTLLGGYLSYGYYTAFNEFFPVVLKHTPPEQILSLLDFYGTYDYRAYRFLALEHFRLIESRVRTDLDNKFETLKSESELRRKQEYVSINWEDDTVDFVRSQFIAAALGGLAQHGNQNDIRYAREFLGKTRHDTADPEAVQIIAKYGDLSDVERILEVASKSHSENKRIALEVALKLGADKGLILEIMLKEGDGATAEKAASELWSLEQGRVRKVAKDLLNVDNTDKRLRGLAVIVKFCGKEELEDLLDEYMVGGATLYYNVVTWLDRTLYAPGRYGESFKKELIEKL